MEEAFSKDYLAQMYQDAGVPMPPDYKVQADILLDWVQQSIVLLSSKYEYAADILIADARVELANK